MVGNDVVDLLDPDTDESTLHPRFDRRAFAECERSMLGACDDPGRERWATWAAKEAAYKLARKLDPTVVFSPPRFVVRWEETRSTAGTRTGRVQHPAGPFEVLLREAPDHIHALALLAGTDPMAVLVGVERPDLAAEYAGPEGPSRAARSLACARVGDALGLPAEALEVHKRGRLPELRLRGEPMAGDLSLSHHGAFVAFAYFAHDLSHDSLPHRAIARRSRARDPRARAVNLERAS